MNENFYLPCELPLTINLERYRQIIDVYLTRNTFSGPMVVAQNLYDPRLVDFLSNFNVKIIHSCLFYTPPNFKKVIHLDNLKFDNHCKLNFIYGADGIMRWYKTKDESYLIEKTTKIGTKYIDIEEQYCDKLYETRVSHSNFVNTGQLHSVENDNTILDRWCLSHVLINTNTGKLLSIVEAYNIFIDFL